MLKQKMSMLMKHYWESNELAECWSLNFEELALLKSKPPKNHLPFCFQLKFYQLVGRFPQSYDEITEAPLKYLKEQLDEFETDEYDWKGRTAKRHRAEILKYLDIRKSTTKEREQFCEWLISDLIPKLSSVKDLMLRSEVWFLRNKLEQRTRREHS